MRFHIHSYNKTGILTVIAISLLVIIKIHLHIDTISSSWSMSNLKSISTIIRNNTSKFKHQQTENRGFVVFLPIGRMGNNIFQYVSAYTLAMKTHHTPIINSNNYLLKIFPNIVAQRENKTFIKSLKPTTIREKKAGFYEKDIIGKINQTKNVIISGFFQSWKYISGYESLIRHLLTISHTIKSKAMHKVAEFRNVYNISNGSERDVTYIGVHVRRGDMTPRHQVARGYCAAPIEYIQRAMDFYRSLFKHPLFIIVSDDIEWCKKNIKKTNNVFFPHGGQAEDFAILVSCNHSVITSGSFSWWAGWLAGGRVVYYSGYPTPGTEIGRMYNRTDYYPPTWIPMQ